MIKDVRRYYEQVSNQYKEMLDEIKDFEKLAEEKLFEPERLDTIKTQIQPLKSNYQMLSYIMFLLNKPSKKKQRYLKRVQNKLKQIEPQYTKAGVIATNQKVLDDLKQ